jgi:hypothetical protein
MGRTKIAGFRRKSYKTLQTLARKTATFHHNINAMDVVQGELISLPSKKVFKYLAIRPVASKFIHQTFAQTPVVAFAHPLPFSTPQC